MILSVNIIGQSMQPEIKNGDIVLIDTSIKPNDKDFVICLYNNMLLCKEYRVIKESIYLDSCNIEYLPIKIKDTDNFKVIGIILQVNHNLNKNKECINNYNLIKSLNNKIDGTLQPINIESVLNDNLPFTLNVYEK